MNADTRTDQNPETRLEVSPLAPSQRAAGFIAFLLNAVPGAELGLGPRTGNCYRFQLAAPPSTIIQALLDSTEFMPVSLRALGDGELRVTLQSKDPKPDDARSHESPVSAGVVDGLPAVEHPAERTEPSTSDERPIATAGEAERAETDALLPLAGALERLDSLLGELREQLTAETAPDAAPEIEAVPGEPSATTDSLIRPDPLEMASDERTGEGIAGKEAAVLETVEESVAASLTESVTMAAMEETLGAMVAPQEPETAPACPDATDHQGSAAEGQRYHIIVGDACPVCRAVSRISFTAERPPQIPIAGCRDTDGCRCSLPPLEPRAMPDAGDENNQDAENRGDGRPLAFHGQIQMVAHPFGNFGRLNQFITMVGGLPGVRTVTLRRFRNGILRLAVDYSGAVPLSSHLRTATEIPLEIVSDSGDLIEIAVADERHDEQQSIEIVSVAARGSSQRRPVSA